MALQKIQVIGNLTRDCVVNNVNSKQVINMSVAVNEKYKNQQGTEVNEVSYYDISYWTESMALAKYLVKGLQVYIDPIEEWHIKNETKKRKEETLFNGYKPMADDPF